MLREGDEPAATELRFTLAVPGVHTVIVGTTKPERWYGNLALLRAGPLAPREYERIRARWAEVATPSWVGKTRHVPIVPSAPFVAAPSGGTQPALVRSTFPIFLTPFREGLRKRGWVEGQNVTIEVRNALGHLERRKAMAAELVRLTIEASLR